MVEYGYGLVYGGHYGQIMAWWGVMDTPWGIILKVTETNLAKNQDLLAFQVHDWIKYGKSGFVIRICFLIPSVTPTQ